MPPRLLFVIDTGGPGGAETVLASLAEGFRVKGWECRVVVPRRNWLFGRLQELGIEVAEIPSSGSADVRFLLALFRELRRFRPDLIHAHLLSAGVYGTLSSVLNGGPPLVCTFHGLPDVPASDSLLGVKARLLSREQNRIVFVSHDLRRHLAPVLRLPEGICSVIHNGVAFSSCMPDGRVRSALGIGEEKKLIGAVGNVRAPKDYSNLLRAARLVLDERPDVAFIVAGEGRGELWDDLMGLRAELGLAPAVHFLGFREDADYIISELDIFVSSSRSEGFPLSSTEAMGFGKPVVLTRCGGVSELVDDGNTGILVPPAEARALASGILRYLNDWGLARRTGEAAREVVRRRFSVDRMVNDYGLLFDDLRRRFGEPSV